MELLQGLPAGFEAGVGVEQLVEAGPVGVGEGVAASQQREPQSPAQPQRVQQFPIRLLSALHTPDSPTPPTRSRAPRPELLSSLLGGWC